jgi:drug/metabolite transporter (DMT)-like permease
MLEEPIPLLIIKVLIGIGAVYELIKLIKDICKRVKTGPGDVRAPRTKSDYFLGVVYSLLCALLWSLSYVSLSYVSSKTDLLNINIGLLGSGCAFLTLGWALAWLFEWGRGTSPKLNVDWNTAAPWVVVATNLASFLLFIYSLYFISASQTITLQKINPLFVVFIVFVWLKRRPSGSTLSAVLLVILGAILIMVNDQFAFAGRKNIIGSLLAILAGASFALFSVGLEKVEQDKKPTLTQRIGFLAVVFFLSYAGIVTVGYVYGSRPVLSLGVSGILLLNGLRIAFVYGLYHAAVRRIGALLTSVLVALEVPFTMLWDWRLLHNTPGARVALGAIAILFGATTLVWDKMSGRNLTIENK